MYYIVGSQKCPWCDKAQALLTEKGLEYTYVDISKDQMILNLFNSTSFKTIPQIWNDSMYIGGYDDLKLIHTSLERNNDA